jgi:hypothetical protein
MKRLVVLTICVMASIVTVCKTVHADQYLGEFCWYNTITHGSSGTGIIKLGITHIGGGHYLASGKYIMIEPREEFEFILRGNAELVNGKIQMSLNLNIYENNTIEDESWNIVLDPVTLNGSYGVIHIETDVSNHFEQKFIGGILTYTTCP